MLWFAFLTLLFGIVEVQGTCNNDNYVQWNDASACYSVKRRNNARRVQTWDEAQATCEQDSATLATIADPEIQEFINVQLYDASTTGGSSDFNAWIGLNDNDTDGILEWINGDTYDDTTFQHWALGEPKGVAAGTQTCVQILSNPYSPGLWKTVDCSSTTSIFVCQMDAEVGSTADPSRNRCPDMFNADGDYLTYREFCFKVIPENIFGIAKQRCLSTGDGASLAVVGSGYYNSFVELLMMRSGLSSAWIGIETSQDVYSSVSEYPITFANWGPMEPGISSTQQACVAINKDTGYWSAEDCSDEKPAICTVPMSPFSPPVKDGQCHKGWQKNGNGCYIYVSEAMTFEDAQNECRQRYVTSYVYVPHGSFDFSLDGVSIDDLSEIWIGVMRDEENKFRAVDNSPLDSVQWASGQPADMASDENCMIISPTSKDNAPWSGRRCNNTFPFFCRYPSITGEIQDGECPDGWYKSDLLCYRRFNERVTFKEASQRCKAEAMGGNLAAPISEKLNALMTYLMKPDDGTASDVWIGLMDVNNERNFEWTNGKFYSFSMWAPGQPDGYLDFSVGSDKNDCVKISSDPETLGLWDDVSCETKLAYICGSYLDPMQARPSPTPNCLGTYGETESCYVFVDDRLTFDEAKKECEKNKMNLVSIRDGHEDGLLKYLLEEAQASSTVWIGLNDQNDDGEYTWGNGWPVHDGSYFNWGTNTPTGGKCVVLASSGRWQERMCSDKIESICKTTTDIPDAPIPDSGYCDDGWDQHVATKNCYLIDTYSQSYEDSTMFITYVDAKRFCKSLGGTLPSIHSAKELEWFYFEARLKLGRRKIWLGMHRNPEGLLRWDDGSAVNYVNWASGEPSGMALGEDCVTMYADNGGIIEWSDSDCFERNAVVCKKPVNPGVKSLCPLGWMDVSRSSACYYFSPAEDRRTWEEAEAVCNQMGAHLATIDRIGSTLDSIRTELLKNYETSAEFWPWIGLKRNLTGEFVWVEEIPSRNSGSFWENGSPPNGKDDDCVVIEVGRPARLTYFHNINCGLRQPFMCRKLASAVDPIIPPTPVEPSYQSCSDNGYLIGTHCYKLQLEPLSWDGAHAVCAKNYSNGDLASIPIYGAQVLISSLLKFVPTKNVWIGLTSRVPISGIPYQYHWIDGTTLRFTNWGSGQPSRTMNEPYCVKMVTDPDAPGKWYDEKCDQEFPYICRYDMDVKGTPAVPVALTPCPDKRFVGSPPSCFRLEKTKRTFSNAKQQCEMVNGILAPVIDGYEDAYIELLMYYENVDSAWIGMKSNEGGRYELTDKSWPKNYIGWGDQEPSLKTGCVASTYSKGWKSFQCDSARASICRSKQDIPPTGKPVDPASECPKDWSLKEGQCYRTNTGFAADNLMNAFFKCSSMGSLPPSIHSRTVNNFLWTTALEEVAGRYIWLGLYLEDGKYRWMDGSQIDYTNWEDGEDPTLNDGKKCVVMTLDRDGKWDRVHCTQQAEIVCMIVDLSYHTTRPTNPVATKAYTSGLSTGGIVGIAVGSGLLAIIIVGWICYNCEKQIYNRKEWEKTQRAKLESAIKGKSLGIENPYVNTMEMRRKESFSESEQTDSIVSESDDNTYEDMHF